MTKGGISWKKVGKVSGKIAKEAVKTGVGIAKNIQNSKVGKVSSKTAIGAVKTGGDVAKSIPWKKVGKVSGKIAVGALKTGLGTLKIAKSIKNRDPYGAFQGVNTVAEGLLGKRNALAKGEAKLDKKLSQHKGYRLAKNGFSLYHDATSGNYTGAYNDSMKLARDIAGKKVYDKSLGKIDHDIQEYVMPSAQFAQNSYGLANALQKPLDTNKGMLQNGMQVYSTVNKIRSTAGSAQKVYNQGQRQNLRQKLNNLKK